MAIIFRAADGLFMKFMKLIWALPLALGAGCVHSHRNPTYTVVPAPAPVSSRPAVRVYPSETTTVVTTPKVVTAPPAIVTTPSTVVTTTPGIYTELPPDVPPTTVASSDNLAMAENIRQALSADPSLNSAARNARISVYNGRVTLTGRAATDLERQRLHTALASLPGVSRVDDRLVVDLPR
jgi:hypothetical protein